MDISAPKVNKLVPKTNKNELIKKDINKENGIGINKVNKTTIKTIGMIVTSVS
jgi:hypothetical protein